MWPDIDVSSLPHGRQGGARLRVRRSARPLRTAAVLAALCVTLLIPANAAAGKHGASKHLTSRMFGFVAGSEPYTNTSAEDFALMHHVRVHQTRLGFTWAELQPHPGAIDWSSVDADLGAAASSGVTALAVLSTTPRWATGCEDASYSYCWSLPGTYNPQSNKAWKAFVNEAVKRYGAHGDFWRENPDLPYRPIHTWQIGNEENLAGHYSPKPSPRSYARLLRITADVVKDRNPRARIALGGLAPGNSSPSIKAPNYLRRLVNRRGVRRSLDIVTIHPYSGTAAGVADIVAGIAKVKKHTHFRVPLWVTEVGWSSDGPAGRFYRGYSGQAKLVRRTFKLFVSHRRAWKLRRVFYFNFKDYDQDVGKDSWAQTAGFRHNDLTPKPAWKQFRRLMKGKG
jgi:hypothetical protein